MFSAVVHVRCFILVLLVEIRQPYGRDDVRHVLDVITVRNFHQVAIAAGSHLFPFRTEKLSPLAPMVLQCNVGE